MPINYLHSLLHRVQWGWDPVSPGYASSYSELAWSERNPQIVDELESLLGGLAGKRVLDLGGGPGQYSVLFAERGAKVTWHDPSRQYEAIARARAAAAQVDIRFSLGYLEEAPRGEVFDLVFCRVCWFYARADRRFARLLYSLVCPGGTGYIDCCTPAYANPRGWRRLQVWLNQCFWLKLGHPLPPHGRIAKLLLKNDIARMTLDYSSPLRDVVIFSKRKSAEETVSLRP